MPGGTLRMISELQSDLDQSVRMRFGSRANDARVKRATAALQANGITVLRAADAAEANRIAVGLIPDGSKVYHGASQTLDVTGITAAIEGSVRFEPLRHKI